MMLDLNENEHWEQAQATAEAREAKNRRRLAVVVILFTCMVLFTGKSALPRRAPPRRRLFWFGLKENKCDGVTCLNGGECDKDTGKCVCPSGFSGDQCQNADVKTCEPPCTAANSVCNPTLLVCQCLPGFVGVYPNCAQDFCAPSPCLNGGTCVNGASDYTCNCPDDFTGTNCETPAADTKIVFVTDNNWNGNLGGLVGADAKCQAAADAEDLDGTFKAWLSDSSQSALSRLSHSAHAYVLPDGTVVANNWDDLLSVPLDHHINRNEKGNPETPREAWTGTNEHGNQHGGHCEDWGTSVATETGAVGINNRVDDRWTDDNTEDWCNWKNHLYCFEQ